MPHTPETHFVPEGDAAKSAERYVLATCGAQIGSCRTALRICG